jgi:hypothetical protein
MWWGSGPIFNYDDISPISLYFAYPLRQLPPEKDPVFVNYKLRYRYDDPERDNQQDPER